MNVNHVVEIIGEISR